MDHYPLTIRPRRGTLDEMNKSEEIPKEYEILVIQETFDEMEPSFKLGDGIHKISELPYVSMDYAFRHGRIYPKGYSNVSYVVIDYMYRGENK